MSIKSISSRKLTSKLIASSLLIAGIAGIAPRTSAEDFIFTGQVDDTCVFDNSGDFDGEIDVDAGGTKLETTVAINQSFFCNTAGKTITISAPAETTVPTAAASKAILTATADINSGSKSISKDSDGNGTDNTTLDYGATTVDITMEADFSTLGSVPAGDYTYTVVLTIAP